MIFVDSSAFVAIENPKDEHHKQAIRFREKSTREGKRFTTNDYILDETFTAIRFKAGHLVAVSFGASLRASRVIMVHHVESEILEEAWEIFKKFWDHKFSFTDCVCFAHMQRMKISEAFSFDKNFREFGKFAVRPS